MESMTFIDVHAHLDHPNFENDIDKVIERAKQAKVNIIVANGVNPETNRMVLQLAENYDIVKAALGIYSIEALAAETKESSSPLNTKPFDIDEELAFIASQKRKIVAIGEVGLDNSSAPGTLPAQQRVFEKIIALAEKIKKPISVHSRKAEKEVLDTLSTTSLKKVHLHCFGGSMKLVERGAEREYYFSIPANVVFSQHFQEMVKRLSINQLLTETDSPFLSPFKGKRNEPAFVVEAVQKIAEIKGFTVEETADNILMNYQRLFG